MKMGELYHFPICINTNLHVFLCWGWEKSGCELQKRGGRHIAKHSSAFASLSANFVLICAFSWRVCLRYKSIAPQNCKRSKGKGRQKSEVTWPLLTKHCNWSTLFISQLGSAQSSTMWHNSKTIQNFIIFTFVLPLWSLTRKKGAFKRTALDY